MRYLNVVTFCLASMLSCSVFAKTVEYELNIDYQNIETEWGSAEGMLVNKQYPAPTLYFNKGDIARITVNNHMDVPTSVHWHGLLVPPEEDGVPYISNFPIPPKGSYTYEFPLTHSGTYWYHSHTNLQEQSGLHGGIVIRPEKPRFDVDYEAVLVLQDFTTENPKQVLANLKKDGDYYAMQKNSVLHFLGYWQANNLKSWWRSRWTRMGGMDVSDVAYDAFFINGKHEQDLFKQAKPGDTILLRTINSGTSSYFFWNASEALDLKVVAIDGVDIQAVSLDEVLHAPAETYDFLITLPKEGRYELRATSQDITGYARVFLGAGETYGFPGKQKPDPHKAVMLHGNDHGRAHGDMNANQKSKDMKMSDDAHAHHMHDMKKTQNQNEKTQYQHFKTAKPSSLPESGVREIELRLTGNMESYVWTFDNVPLSAADKIKIQRGEVVRVKFINETMMHHPLHLHGHFFRVLVGNGANEPLKHTVNVEPMQTTTIEFFANEEKDWFFHCHNLYHAKTGMARVFSYQGDQLDPALMEAKKRNPDIKDTDFYYSGKLKLLDDYARLSFDYSNIWHGLSLETSRYDYKVQATEIDYLYQPTRWTHFFIGLEDNELETLGRVGFTYTLPLLLETKVFVTEEGEAELELETDLRLTKHIQAHIEWSTEGFYHSGLEYRFNQQFSLEAAYSEGLAYSVGGQLRF